MCSRLRRIKVPLHSFQVPGCREAGGVSEKTFEGHLLPWATKGDLSHCPPCSWAILGPFSALDALSSGK